MKRILLAATCVITSITANASIQNQFTQNNVENHIQAFNAICYANKNNLEDMHKVAEAMGWKLQDSEKTRLWGLPDHYTGINHNFRTYSMMVKEGPEMNMCTVRQEVSYTQKDDRLLFVKLLQAQYPLQKDTKMIDQRTVDRLLHGSTYTIPNDGLESYNWFNKDGYLIGVHFFDGKVGDKNYNNVRIELTRF